MNDQFLFSDMPAALEAEPVTSVFLAILPEQTAAEKIARCACEVRDRHGLTGTPRPTGRFHVSLHAFDHAPRALERSLQMAQMVAAKAVRGVSPFEVRFDRVKSFSEKKSNCPCVLADRDGNELLRAFVSQLKREMGKAAGHFTPHVTLLYDDAIVKEEYVEPVSWRINDIVLLKAITHRKTFQELGRWAFEG